MKESGKASVRRLSKALEEPVSTVGRWCAPSASVPLEMTSPRPGRTDPRVTELILILCEEDRNRKHGHRRIRALLNRRYGLHVNRKTVYRIMKAQGLLQEKLRYKQFRTGHVSKMTPDAPNHGWQIDMTSFKLSDMTTLYLEIVIDCCTRKIVGWNLDRRCRAKEWIAAVRTALENQGLIGSEDCRFLTIRSDNGAQPCSKDFVAYLYENGVAGEYTGYNAPNDNAFVERVMRTIKEEEVWGNQYDSWVEAHQAVEKYITYYNSERIHSALNYRTPNEAEADWMSQSAA